jgi:biotin-dependent carboxylase-like uncharacterized protein
MIEVVSPGLYTTVQDAGRYGYRSAGVPVSGAMDAQAALLANTALGNTKNEALLEITLLGPTLKFHSNTTIAIAGAPFSVLLNDMEIATQQPMSIQKNDVLQLGKAKKGMRCYLAVAGGLQTELALFSRSYYADVTSETKLTKGAILPIGTAKTTIIPCSSGAAVSFETNIVHVYSGPEFALLPQFQQKALLETHFKISAQSNRMATILEGNAKFSAKEILTAPVQPGTVQVTPSGKLLILMRDAQVTGGYARIFQLTEASINILAQKRGGESVVFRLTSLL